MMLFRRAIECHWTYGSLDYSFAGRRSIATPSTGVRPGLARKLASRGKVPGMTIQKPPMWIMRSVPVEALGRAPKNSNKMSPAQRIKLGAAVHAYGMIQPLLVRRLPACDGIPDLEEAGAEKAIRALECTCFEVVDGHHRLDEVIRDGATEVPVVVIDCSPERARVIALEMNRLHGDLDMAMVAVDFAELTAAGVTSEELLLSSFDQDEIDALMKSLGSINQSENVMAGGAGADDQPANKPEKPFELTLAFSSATILKKINKALSKLAGGGRRPDRSLGLLRALGLDEEG